MKRYLSFAVWAVSLAGLIAGPLIAADTPPTLGSLLAEASQKQAAGNAAGAEDCLTRAAAMVASKDDSGRWAAAVWEFVRLGKSLDDSLPAVGRLAAMANEEMKHSLGAALVGGARSWVLNGETDKGGKLLTAIKGLTALQADLDLLQRSCVELCQAQVLAKAGDHVGASKSFEAAMKIAAGNEERLRDMYTVASRIVNDCIWARQPDAAAKYISFIIEGPGKAVAPFRLNVDVARMQASLGKLPDAESHLAQAAPLIKTKDDARAWSELAWLTITLAKSDTDAVAAYRRLAALAASDDANASLAATSLAGVQSFLCDGRYDKGIALMPPVKEFAATCVAATLPDNASSLQFVEQLAKAQASAKAGDIELSIRSFLAAQVLATDKPDRMRAVYSAAYTQAGVKAHGKDAAAVDKYASFLASVPGIAAFDLHYDLVNIRWQLGQVAVAQDEVVKAAGSAASDKDWQKLLGVLGNVVGASQPFDSAVELVNKLSPMCTSDAAKRTVAKACIGAANHHMRRDLAKGTCMLALAKGFAVASDDVKVPIAILEQLALVQERAKSNDINGSVTALAAAAGLAAGDPGWQNTVYEASFSLLHARVAAKDKTGAESVVAFITREPMLVDPWRVHIDVARIQRERQEFTAAETQLAQAAALLKPGNLTVHWADTVAGLFGSMKPEDAHAAFGRLAALATANEAKQRLAQSFLNLAGRELMQIRLERGRLALDEAKSIASQFEGLAETVGFLEQLAAAQTLAKDGNVTGAIEALAKAQGLAAQKPEWLNGVYSVGRLLAYARLQAADAQSSVQLARFLTQGCGTALDPWNFHVDMIGLNNALREFEVSKAFLTSAVPLLKTDAHVGTWCNLVWQVVSGSKQIEDGIAALNALAPYAKGTAAEAKLAETVTTGIRQWLLSGDFPRGIKMVPVMSSQTAPFPAHKPMVEFLSHLAKALELGQPSSSDASGTLEALKAAKAVAAQDKQRMNDLYRVAVTITRWRVGAGDVKTSPQLMAFLRQDCSSAAEPWVFHIDMAGLCMTTRERKEAEEHLAGLAASIKTDAEATTWSNTVWNLLEHMPAAEAAAALGRIAPLATTPVAKSNLARRLVAGTRSWLCGGGFDKGIAVLDITRQAAAGEAELQLAVSFLGHLAKAHEFGLAKKIDNCIEELKAAQTLAGEREDWLRDIYAVARVQARRRSQWRDRASCGKLFAFMMEGPGRAIRPFTLHSEIAWIYIDMHQSDGIAEAMKAVATAQNDQDWQRLHFVMGGAVGLSRTRQAAVDLLDLFESAANTEAARKLVGIVRSNFFLHRNEPADAESALAKVLPKEGKPDERFLTLMYCISDCYARTGAMPDAVRTFGLAEAMATAFTDAQRDKWFRFAYYGWDGQKRPLRLFAILEQALKAAADPSVKARLVPLAVEAAGAEGRHLEGAKMIREQQAGPEQYLLLVQSLVQYGSPQAAVEAAKSIPKEALDKDPSLAQKIQVLLGNK